MPIHCCSTHASNATSKGRQFYMCLLKPISCNSLYQSSAAVFCLITAPQFTLTEPNPIKITMSLAVSTEHKIVAIILLTFRF